MSMVPSSLRSEDHGCAQGPTAPIGEARSLVQRLDGRAHFFDSAPLDASRSNLGKSADLFREAARRIEELTAALKAIKTFGERNCEPVRGYHYTGGKKLPTKEVWQFPLWLLNDIDAALGEGEVAEAESNGSAGRERSDRVGEHP